MALIEGLGCLEGGGVPWGERIKLDRVIFDILLAGGQCLYFIFNSKSHYLAIVLVLEVILNFK